MTTVLCILAGSLYGLGAFGGGCLISRDAPLGPREFFVLATWPVAMVAVMIWALADYAIRGARP